MSAAGARKSQLLGHRGTKTYVREEAEQALKDLPFAEGDERAQGLELLKVWDRNAIQLEISSKTI